ncbi:MAG: serine hydrolase [Novosphingobium sp.]|nr:serine hydrolase [Novosphingobium sp.]
MLCKGSTGYNHIVMKTRFKSLLLGMLALAGGAFPVGSAGAGELEDVFDNSVRVARPLQPAYSSALEAQVAALANGAQGRIGVAAIDLASGRSVSVLGNQPFPLASTSKIAIAATYLDGVDQGRFRLSDQFPLMIPVPSAKFSSGEAPVRPGAMLSAERLIELSLTRSDNHATDALLAAIGGPAAVNRWLARTGLSGFHIDRTIATLVRDDGAINPAFSVDPRDSVTPLTMVRLLSGLYQGQWLTPASRSVLLGAMSRCVTGKNRLRAMLPADARIAHKTGTLNNTSSDVGIIETPDGRAIAVAVYVTGQGGKPGREQRIASIARAIYDGYSTDAYGQRLSAVR